MPFVAPETDEEVFIGPEHDEEPGLIGSMFREAGRSAGPLAAGATAGKATAAMLLPAAQIPVVGPAIPIVGGGVAALIAMIGARRAQESLANRFAPESMFGSAQTEADIQAHPWGTMAAGFLAMGPPSPTNLYKAVQTVGRAEGRQALGAAYRAFGNEAGTAALAPGVAEQLHNVAGVGMNIGLGVGQGIVEGGDMGDILTGAVGGALFNRSWFGAPFSNEASRSFMIRKTAKDRLADLAAKPPETRTAADLADLDNWQKADDVHGSHLEIQGLSVAAQDAQELATGAHPLNDLLERRIAAEADSDKQAALFEQHEQMKALAQDFLDKYNNLVAAGKGATPDQWTQLASHPAAQALNPMSRGAQDAQLARLDLEAQKAAGSAETDPKAAMLDDAVEHAAAANAPTVAQVTAEIAAGQRDLAFAEAMRRSQEEQAQRESEAGEREAEMLAGRRPGEEIVADLDQAVPPIPEPVLRVMPETETSLVDVPSQEVPATEIVVRPDLMQFKRQDNLAAGTNAAERLEGKWDDLKAGMLLLWEPADPAAHGLEAGQRYIIANGHHRFEFGQAQDVKAYNAQIVREADGFSAEAARTLGAAQNIADGKGTIYDQAKFIRNLAATHGADATVAEARRFGARGRKAMQIGLFAENPLFDSFINEQISPDHAEAIARAAPNDGPLQDVGLKRALAGDSPEAAVDWMKVMKDRAGGKSESQGDLFGNVDDAAMKEMEEQIKVAQAERKHLREQIKAVKGAARNPEMAKKLGVDVADPEGLQKRIADLEARLEHINRHPEDAKPVTEEAVPPPSQPELPTEPPDTAPEIPIGARVKITLGDGRVIEGIVQESQGIPWMTVDGETFILKPEINPDIKIHKVEVLEDAGSVLKKKQDKKFGTLAYEQPTTRDQYENTLWDLARKIREQKKLVDMKSPDYNEQSARVMQLEAQFEKVANEIELAKTKRLYMQMGSAISSHFSGKQMPRPIDIKGGVHLEAALLEPPKPSDFHPSSEERGKRTARPAHALEHLREIELSLEGAKDDLARGKKSPQKKQQLQNIIARREKEIASGNFIEARVAAGEKWEFPTREEWKRLHDNDLFYDESKKHFEETVARLKESAPKPPESLIPESDLPFNLASETAAEKAAREAKEAAAKTAADEEARRKAAEEADKNQGKLFSDEPPAPEPKKPAFRIAPEEQARIDALKTSLGDKLKKMISPEPGDPQGRAAGVPILDPEFFQQGAELASIYIKAGLRGFKELAEQLISDLGEKARRYLLSWYSNAKLKNPNLANELDSEPEAERIFRESFYRPDAGGRDVSGEIRGGGAGGEGPGTARPGVRVARNELIPQPKQHVGTDTYARGTGRSDIFRGKGEGVTLDPEQVRGINLMLDRITREGGGSFLLADGTGFGKTIQMLAVADQYRKASPGARILIVTQNKSIAETRFKVDAERMGVDPRTYEITTYSSIKKLPSKKWDLVIFDEAHNMKNAEAQKSIAAGNLESARKIFATATPMDRPTGAAYFLSEITGRPEDVIANDLGYSLVERTDRYTQEPYMVPVLNEGMTWQRVWNNIMEHRDAAVAAGAMVRREYPFFGDVSDHGLGMPPEAGLEQRHILKHYHDLIDNTFNPQAKRNYSGQKTLTLSRWSEQQKLEEAVKLAKEHIDNGGQVVIVAETNKEQSFPVPVKGGVEGINDRGRSVWRVEGAITKLDAMLRAAGFTDIAHINDPTSNKIGKEVERFQNGEAKVALATPQSGGTGIDLDDVVGTRPRLMIVLSKNLAGDAFEQLVGRVSRKNTQSASEVRFLTLRGSYADQRREDILDTKIRTLRAIQGGEDLDVAGGFQQPQPPGSGPTARHAAPDVVIPALSKRTATDAITRALNMPMLPAGIEVIHDPEGAFAGRIQDGKIIINSAKTNKPASVVMEEGLHGVWNDPRLQKVWKEWRDAVTDADIEAERQRRVGLDEDPNILREEAAIRRLLENRESDKPWHQRIFAAIRDALKRLFGIEVPSTAGGREMLIEAAKRFLVFPNRGEIGERRFSAPEPDKTVVMGQEIEIGSRPHYSAQRAREAIANSHAQLEGLGIESELIEQPDPRQENVTRTWLKFDPDTFTPERAKNLADFIESELRADRGLELTPLLASIRTNLMSGENTEFRDRLPVDLRLRLTKLAQSEASQRGLSLGAFAFHSIPTDQIFNDPELHLARQWHGEFGGDSIAGLLDEVARVFPDNFTPEELADIEAGNPDIPAIMRRMIQEADKPPVGRVKRWVDAVLAPKKGKSKSAKQSFSIDREAADAIIEQAKKLGVVEKPPLPNQKLTPDERLAQLVTPENQEKVTKAIENAVWQAERTAARENVRSRLAGEFEDADEFRAAMEAYDQRTMDPDSDGPDPTSGEIAAGMTDPRHSHWKDIRDNLLGYDPITTKLAQDVIKGRFKGTKFGPKIEKPEDLRIDIKKLAVQPEAEIERVMQAQLDALDKIMGGRPLNATNVEVLRIVRENLEQQVAQAKGEIVKNFLDPKELKAPKTASQRVQELINAGIANDPRHQGGKFRKLVRKAIETRIPKDELTDIAGKTRAEKVAWMNQKFADIIRAENWDASNAADVADFLKAETWTELAETVGDAERALATRLVGGKDVVFDPEVITPTRRAEIRQQAIDRLQQALNTGAFDQRMIGTVAKKPVIQKFMPSMSDLVRTVLGTPRMAQADMPAAFSREIQKLFQVDPATADKFGEILARAYSEKFRSARKLALEKAVKMMTPTVIKDIGPGTPTWKRIEQITNSGDALETVNVLRKLAEDAGYRMPTYEEVQRLHQLSQEEQRIRRLTDADRTRGITTQREKDAETYAIRQPIIHKMETLWASLSRPIAKNLKSWWNSPVAKQNFAHAANEYASANLLARASFAVKQVLDVATQMFVHTPTRAMASAMERFKADRAAGRETRLWKDFSSALKDSIQEQVKTFNDMVTKTGETFAGRTHRTDVMGLQSHRGVEGKLIRMHALERMVERANALDAEGKHTQAFLLRTAALVRYSYRFAAALDTVQQVPAGWQEARQYVAEELRRRGVPAADVETATDGIVGDHARELMLAKAIVGGSPDIPPSRQHAAAWDLVWARMVERMQADGIDAKAFEQHVNDMRQTIGWNSPEEGGPGYVVKSFMDAMTGWASKAGLPMPVARFSNAIAIGINRALTFAGGGFAPKLFEGSNWYKTPKDIAQRKVEAAIGVGFIAPTFFTLAANGMIRVYNEWPKDPEDRQLWERDGHRPNTIEFNLGDKKFMRLSTNTGLFAPFRSILAAIGSVQDKIQAKDIERKKAGLRAQKRNLATTVKELSPQDILLAALKGGWSSVTQGRTTAGMLGQTRDYGDFNLPKATASFVAPLIPFQPFERESAMLSGTNIDPRDAGMLDFLAPGPWSKQRENFLGDPVGTAHDQDRIWSMLTGGSVPRVQTQGDADTRPYKILRTTGYRPPSIQANALHEINGRLTALSGDRLERYVNLRANYLKAALRELPPTASKEDAAAAYKEANKKALEAVGVTVRE